MPDESLRVPAFCPHCGGMMKGRSTYTFYDYKCCIDCFIWFLEGRPEKITEWKAGWRPNEEQMTWFRESMKN
jgi:hypothetical protein